MKKNRVYNLLRRFTDKTVPTASRWMMQRWLISNQEVTEKEETLCRLWEETNVDAGEGTRRSLLVTKRRIGQMEQRKPHPKLLVRMWRYAAILLLPLATGVTVYLATSRQEVEPDMVECYVPNGEQRTLELSDGSKIQVNSGTLFIYPRTFQGKNRLVYLSGEANFEVVKNQHSPFIVRTGPLKVQVLGTKFNVASYPGEGRIVTTLERGVVKVYKNESPDKAVILKPNEQLTYNGSDGNFHLSRTDAKVSAAWTKGEVRFTNQPLSEILKTLERRYDVSFRYDTGLQLSELYTMKFKQYETIEDVIRVFTQLAGNIGYRLEGKVILLYPVKKGGNR